MQTFIVRVWSPPDAACEATRQLRGVVEHVSTQETSPFRTTEELLAFVRGRSGVGHSAQCNAGEQHGARPGVRVERG